MNGYDSAVVNFVCKWSKKCTQLIETFKIILIHQQLSGTEYIE